jgi:polysaccharide export outer membrane protein
MIAVMAGIVTLLPLGTVSAGSGAVTEGVDPYVIGPDDTLRITVAQHPEWSGEFSVGPDGRIVISGMGEFTVGGMGKERAETALRDAMERYINNPRVSVEIVKYASQVIYVLGEVNRPGRYSTEGKVLTLRDAVILAGLPTRYAADSRVYVITPAPGKPRQQVINLYRILNRGEMRRNIALKPGDIVYVPQSILGMVNELLSILLSPLGSVNTARTVASPLP